MSYGIDYGLGKTNIDPDTGIRFGVIPANDLGSSWFEASDAEYAESEDEEAEPICFSFKEEGYKAFQSYEDSDVFIEESPFFTYAQFCSPCAPGACYLRHPVDTNGPKAYCFAPDWFNVGNGEDVTGEYEGEKTSCPYPVYRVSDGECIFTPSIEE